MTDHDLLIELNAKVDSIKECLSDLESLYDRTRQLEIKQEAIKNTVEVHSKEIEKLRNTNTVWSSINSFAVIIGTALGIRLG